MKKKCTRPVKIQNSEQTSGLINFMLNGRAMKIDSKAVLI